MSCTLLSIYIYIYTYIAGGQSLIVDAVLVSVVQTALCCQADSFGPSKTWGVDLCSENSDFQRMNYLDLKIVSDTCKS